MHASKCVQAERRALSLCFVRILEGVRNEQPAPSKAQQIMWRILLQKLLEHNYHQSCAQAKLDKESAGA